MSEGREGLEGLAALAHQDRLRLMKFVCSFAWADLEVRPEERHFVERMVERLGLDEAEARAVREWLRVPPGPEAVDPTAVPQAHRRVFLEAIEGVIRADGEVAPEERESLQLFRSLLRESG